MKIILNNGSEIEVAQATYDGHYVINCNSRAAYDAMWDNFTTANLEDFKLVDEIMAETDPGSKNKREQLNDAARKRFFHKWLFEAIKAKQETKKQNKEFKSRTNQSFASKFCHYACLYVFKGNKEADNFSIYDKILETVLPWYWSRFKVGELKKSGKFNYEEYSEVIDEIRIENSKNGYMISRNGLDHLLWYYHKGRLKQDNDPQKMQQVSPG